MHENHHHHDCTHGSRAAPQGGHEHGMTTVGNCQQARVRVDVSEHRDVRLIFEQVALHLR